MVDQREQVVLVRAAPVEEDEGALGITRGGPQPMAELVERSGRQPLARAKSVYRTSVYSATMRVELNGGAHVTIASLIISHQPCGTPSPSRS